MSGVASCWRPPQIGAAVEEHVAARGRPQAHDGAQGRRLAGAVAAEQHRHLAGRHLEVDAVQDVIRADVRVHAGELQQRGHVLAALAASGSGRWALCALVRLCLLDRCDAEIGVLHDRRCDHRGRLAVGDQLAVVQHDDAVGEFARPRPSCARPAGWSCRPRPSARGSGRGSPARRRRSCRRSARRTCRPRARAPSASRPRACAGRRAAGCWPRASARSPSARARPAPARARASRGRSSQTDHRLMRRRRRDCTARRTFSSTVRFGNSCVSWNARPSPRCVRAEAGSCGDVRAVEPHRALARAQLARDQVEVGRLAGAVRPDDRRQRAGRERRSVTWSTATWPPKRIVRSSVSSIVARGPALAA